MRKTLTLHVHMYSYLRLDSDEAYGHDVNRHLVPAPAHVPQQRRLDAVAQAKRRYVFSISLITTKSRLASILEV